METALMTREDSDLLDYLLGADFSTASGKSYGELVEYLVQYQRLYRMLYDNYYHMVRQEHHRNAVVSKLETQMVILERKLLTKSTQISNLQGELTRKLTWWERFTGKLKL